MKCVQRSHPASRKSRSLPPAPEDVQPLADVLLELVVNAHAFDLGDVPTEVDPDGLPAGAALADPDLVGQVLAVRRRQLPQVPNQSAHVVNADLARVLDDDFVHRDVGVWLLVTAQDDEVGLNLCGHGAPLCGYRMYTHPFEYADATIIFLSFLVKNFILSSFWTRRYEHAFVEYE